jgi:hypothetical protein
MLTIYRLRSDKDFIAQVQKATVTTERFGIESTHGLFGSPEWWQHVRDGMLPVHTLRGAITRVYMGSMNDWPEFTMRSDTGQESSWSRYASDPVFASLYTVGRRIELDSLCSDIVLILSMTAQRTRYRLKFASMKTSN